MAVSDGLTAMLTYSVIFGFFLALPAFLILTNLISTFRTIHSEKWRKRFLWFDRIAVVLGAFDSYLAVYLFTYIRFEDWDKVLVNSEVHSPVWSGGRITVLVLAALAIVGYVVLSSIKLSRLSPLVIVCCIAAMYLGILLCVVWMVQIIGMADNTWILCIVPGNCIMIALKTIRMKIQEWNTSQKEREFSGKNKLLSRLNQMLSRAEEWPVAAFIAMLPMLGIVIGILVLFGQQPDAIIKAWTETSDWRLSEKIAPQNIDVDEHYLCTVAAGGHRRVVKPVRMGQRHGHPVVVNRQLCIANAFEQILEEKTPHFHCHVRHFYDTYGFPVAKMVRSRYTADVIYILMKPLEWIFLAVIYACDTKPENRIAVQYLPELPVDAGSCH